MTPSKEKDATFDAFNPDAEDRPSSNPTNLLPSPPWRQFKGEPPAKEDKLENEAREAHYKLILTETAPFLINTALLLRRPLLVTGSPGTGKSSLAYHVARKLGFGRVLRWNITSRSTLKDGLYSYDVLQRLHDASLLKPGTGGGKVEPPKIDAYLRLGPLGTALLPSKTPRVLLIDELDKSDVDLPNDLLHVFEEGKFEIPELKRVLESGKSEQSHATVKTDDGRTADIKGDVECCAFPFVILTSNAEREFPPAFVRRCIRLPIPDPKAEELVQIANSHLGNETKNLDKLIEEFEKSRRAGVVANDQLLNALYVTNAQDLEALSDGERKKLIDWLIAPLNRAGLPT